MRTIAFLAALFSLFAGPAMAKTCGNNASGYPAWLAGFKESAVRAGISRRTVDAAFANVRYDKKVIARDRSQKSFKYSLEKFIALRAPASTIAAGRRHMRSNAKLLSAIESRYGVQREILIAIWGLESGFGRFMGNIPLFQSLSTLAYDCRRSAFFTNELMSALVIAERGEMSIAEMKGAWAGEIGQTQFLASNYARFAVDFDRDGKRDLIRSRADVLASTANFLRRHGWRKGRGWAEGQANFRVLKRWNRSTVYQRTIAYMATKLSQ